MDRSMRRKLQDAWDNRTSDNKLRFPDGTNDWLIVDTVRYKKSEKFTNGTFILTLDEATEDHFGKSCDGLNISLTSYDVMDTLETLSECIGNDAASSRLLTYIRDLQGEAVRISSLLDDF